MYSSWTVETVRGCVSFKKYNIKAKLSRWLWIATTKTLQTLVYILFENSVSVVVVKSKIWTPCKVRSLGLGVWGGGEGLRKIENPWTRMLENPPKNGILWLVYLSLFKYSNFNVLCLSVSLPPYLSPQLPPSLSHFLLSLLSLLIHLFPFVLSVIMHDHEGAILLATWWDTQAKIHLAKKCLPVLSCCFRICILSLKKRK